MPNNKNASMAPASSLAELPSLKTKQVTMSWDANIYKNAKIKSDVENTWIIQKTLTLPNLADFHMKVGNKDYYLNATIEEGEKTSELAMRKRYG